MTTRIYRIVFILLFALPVSVLQAQETGERQFREIIALNAARLGISGSDLANLVISSHHTDPQTGISYLYLQQVWQDIHIFNSVLTVALRDGRIVYSAGRFVPYLDEKAGSPVPRITAEEALRAAAAHLDLVTGSMGMPEDRFAAEKRYIFSETGISRQPVEVRLYWVMNDDLSSVTLAWNVNIDMAGSENWWNIRINAATGEYIEKDNWTVHESGPDGTHAHSAACGHQKPAVTGTMPVPPTVATAQYQVVPLPVESPNHGAFSTEIDPWLRAGGVNPATTYGWHYDGVNNYIITRGNNVFAYLDVQNTNSPNAGFNWPDTSSTAIPALSFTASPNFLLQPTLQDNRKSAVTNLFYWNNIIHDISYQYGFNEASGNFQADNMGRGGLGNDYVQAEAQDASGMNNANFSTPADGARPRMQMYLFSAVPLLMVNSPSAISGSYTAVESAFSTANKLASTGPVTGQLVYYDDNSAGSQHEACVPPANQVAGKIALIRRGNCNFTVKVKNAQDAGAIAVIMINNVPGAPITMGGTDNSIVIPAVMISLTDGNLFVNHINSPVNVTLMGGVNRDADFDNGIIVHEYGHGISNRLTGGRTNSSCLSNAEQAGEGWSDYLALMLTTDWSTAQLTDGELKRPIGTYAFGQPVNGNGIRAFPYSTSMNMNPLTYANMASNPQVHYIGTIWCSALWDMTWNIIQQTGSIEPDIYNSSVMAGNVVALRLVMEGMRLQPCRPGFLDSRDAILAADSILYNGQFRCAIWAAFARRGMGFSARQGLSTNGTDQVPAYDLPSSIQLFRDVNPVITGPGSDYQYTITAQCNCAVPASPFILRDTIPSGFDYISSSGGTLNGNIVSFAPAAFSSPGEEMTFSVTVKAISPGCILDTVIHMDGDNSNIGFSSVTDAGPMSWNLSSLRSHNGNYSWLAPNSAAATDFSLTSQPFFANELTLFSFWHYFVTENQVDGGRVEISTDGTNWMDAAPYFIRNGYSRLSNVNSSWGPAVGLFTGVSYGQGTNDFMNTLLDLTSFSGQNIRVRLRMRTNAGNPSGFEGWFADDLILVRGCGGTFRAGLYNSSGIVATAAVPVFVQSDIIPIIVMAQPSGITACDGSVAVLTISASSGSQPLEYQWQISTDGGNSFADIAGANQSVLQLNPVTASMNGYLYRCRVGNGLNEIYSAAATLNIMHLPVVAAVADQQGCTSAPVNFSSPVTGTGFQYQWQVSSDGGNTFSNINGAVNPVLLLTNITAAMNNYRYRVVITNSCGSTASLPGLLTVSQTPSVVLLNIPTGMVCTTDSIMIFTASLPGGSWTGPGMSGNYFNPALASPGITTVTYSVTSAEGCMATVSAPIQVSACNDRMLTIDAPGAITIFPNPNTGRFVIRFNTSLYTMLRMNIYASDGKLVKMQELTGLGAGVEVPVTLMELAGAVYNISLFDPVSRRERTFRIIISR